MGAHVEYRSVRIGTWSVDYAAGEERNAARLERLINADCDVLVLTETHDALASPWPHVPVASARERPGCRQLMARRPVATRIRRL
jgi:hypothetical protein